MKHAIRAMAEQGSGHIVQITASIVDQPINGVPAILASITKGGLAAATKGLAIEYAGQGIRVNAISPGVVDTPLHVGLDAAATYAQMHPQNRIGTVADIIHGALYLETAPFVTGEVLHIDGGQSAGH